MKRKFSFTITEDTDTNTLYISHSSLEDFFNDPSKLSNAELLIGAIDLLIQEYITENNGEITKKKKKKDDNTSHNP